MKTSTADAAKLFLLGMITALLAVIAFRPNQAATYAGTGGVGNAGGLIAVTGEEKGTLFLVDPVNKYVAQYAVDNARFSLRGARYFKQDLYIRDENRRGGIPVEMAEKMAQRSMREQ